MRILYFGIFLILAVFTANVLLPAPADAKERTLKQLKSDLRKAKQNRAKAVKKAELATARVETVLALRSGDGSAFLGAHDGLATSGGIDDQSLPATDTFIEGVLADGHVSNEELAQAEAALTARNKAVTRWKKKVTVLQKRIKQREQIARWNRNGQWWPLIKIAAKKEKINANGLRRLMMLESGGRRYAGTTYKGLFQYHPGTWRGSWNPWRNNSVYDGWSQIRATALAMRKGMGPGHWPNTYPRAF